MNIISFLKLWFQAVRAPFFTASAIPVLLSIAFALWQGDPVSLPFCVLMLSCVVLLHAGTNCLNDYYDYIKGVDTQDSYGSSRVIVDGLMQARKMKTAGLFFLALGACLGIFIGLVRGPLVLVMGFAGLAGAYFYSGKFGLKYVGLGDIAVFVLMGPLLLASSYFVITGVFKTDALLVALPIGFLVTAILHANNTRDMSSDRLAGISTFALKLGQRGAKLQYYALLSGAYLSVCFMVLTGVVPFLSLFVLLSLPLAWSNIRKMSAAGYAGHGLAVLDLHSARLHLVFGVLFSGSFLLAVALK